MGTSGTAGAAGGQLPAATRPDVGVEPLANAELKALNFCSGSISIQMNQGASGGVFSSGHGLGWEADTNVVIRIGTACAVAVPPTAPTNLRVTPGDGVLTVNWRASTTGNYSSYELAWKEQAAADQDATTAGERPPGTVRVAARTGAVSAPGAHRGALPLPRPHRACIVRPGPLGDTSGRRRTSRKQARHTGRCPGMGSTGTP